MHSRRIAITVLVLASVVGLFYRFSTDVFGQNTMSAVICWHTCADGLHVLLAYLASMWAPRQYKGFLRSLSAVFLLHMINSIFYFGEADKLDMIGISYFILFTIYKVVKYYYTRSK